jgi:transposase
MMTDYDMEQVAELAELDKETLIAVIISLRQEIEALRDQLAKNSGNSGKPPSSDGLKKPRSQRQKGQRRSGGQPGHPGHTLQRVEQPDQIERHGVNRCPHCATDLHGLEPRRVEKRQVFELPPAHLVVTEHQAEVKQCPTCGQEVKGCFPPDVTQPVQYGPRFKAQAVYLNSYQLLPLARTCEVLEAFYGHAPSQALVWDALTSVVGYVQPVVAHIKQQLTQAALAHFDESGVRVEGHLNWLHVASTAHLTYYAIQPKRGQVGMSAIGILPAFRGRAVHDHWPSYLKFEACQHAFCNAHHLRELQFITDQYHQAWASDLQRLLLDIKAEVEAAPPDRRWLAPNRLAHYECAYDALLHEGWAANPSPEPPLLTRRGRKKQSPPRNLLTRLARHKTETLAFMHDFRIPFDNNQAERDIRMVKLKAKISGTFRSRLGADAFCILRSYLSTVRKHGANVIQSIHDAFLGQPFIPLAFERLPE